MWLWSEQIDEMLIQSPVKNRMCESSPVFVLKLVF